MKTILLTVLMAVALPALAQTGLDQLLNQVRESAEQTRKLNQEREQRFIRNKKEQAGLLAKAEAERAAVESRVAGVKSRFDANQRELTALKAQLATRAGDFTQVYSAARTAATDLRIVLADSFINAQFPERLEQLDDLAKKPALPSISELEGLWLVMQEEMTEQGRTARFRAEVTDPLGEKRSEEVVRVGAFTAFAGRDYLTVPEGGGTLRACHGSQPVPIAIWQRTSQTSARAWPPFLSTPHAVPCWPCRWSGPRWKNVLSRAVGRVTSSSWWALWAFWWPCISWCFCSRSTAECAAS